jgi:hypothetical protein
LERDQEQRGFLIKDAEDGLKGDEAVAPLLGEA